MLKSLIQQSDFKALSQFVSPNFFSVVSVGECFKVVSRVLLDSRSEAKCDRAREAVRRCVAPLGVNLVENPLKISSALHLRFSELVLQCYFKQIFESPVWLLDFRKERWLSEATGLIWTPSSYFHVPSELFRNAVNRTICLGC